MLPNEELVRIESIDVPKAGIATFHGHTHFLDQMRLQVSDDTLVRCFFLIACQKSFLARLYASQFGPAQRGSILLIRAEQFLPR